MSSQELIRFEDFELDPERYQLRRAGQIQKLEKIPMELLLLLAGKPGILVSRREITERLWGPGVFIESERGINTAIGKIRRVLDDNPDEPRYLQTVVGKGYRFIAPIHVDANGEVARLDVPLAQELPPSPLPSIQSAGEPETASSVSSRRKTISIAIAATGLLAVVLLAATSAPVREWLPWLSPGIRSIAVLPMANLAHDPREEYFVDGMTDELITSLARSTSLRVISRTSVMQFKNANKSLPEIARALNVDAVVEGSVLRYNGQLKIEAQLLDARRDRHLWAQTYQSKDDQALRLQDEVTRDIAEHVAATLRPNAAKNSREEQSANLAGYEDYLRGRYYLARRTSDTLRKAAEYFQKAINADPNYAPAYVGLADTYNVISFYGGPPPSESFPKAEAAAKRALALDDKLGEAHAALGDTLFSYYWDWKGADREFRRAINLNPGSAVTHHWYSELLSMLGRHTEAISEIQKAAQLDPLSLVINGTVGGAYYLARRYTEAEKQVRQTLELDERFGPAHDLLGWVYLEQNRKREAIAEFKMAVALSGNSPYEEAALGCAYGRVGDYRRAREIAADLEFRSKQQYVSPEALARVYVALGENNLAIDRLETAYKTHVDTLNNIYVEPCYDVIRSDPRFQNLIRRMHFVS